MTIQVVNNAELVSQIPMSPLERSIYEQKRNSSVVYRYESPEALAFELNMRSRIVDASLALFESNAQFAVFEQSACNEKYWHRQNNGGFRLREDVLPSEGVMDIFRNGNLYAFECATAMVIVLYKATLDMLGARLFNTYFTNLLLYDWQYDSNLRIVPVYDRNESYAGDIVYFENPDHNPETPEWQGENAVKLAGNTYYGHGIGIKTAEEMLAILNRKRKPGSTTLAYQSDLVLHPDFEYLRYLSTSNSVRWGVSHCVQEDAAPILVRIGDNRYSNYEGRTTFLGGVGTADSN